MADDRKLERWNGTPTKRALRELRMAGSELSVPQAVEFLKHIAAGRSLVDVCETAGLPDIQTVYAWRYRYPEFDALYINAVEQRADYLIAYAEHVLHTEQDSAMLTARVNAAHKLAACRSKRYQRANETTLRITDERKPAELSDAELLAIVGESRLIEGNQ